jgi:beta-glucosidase
MWDGRSPRGANDGHRPSAGSPWPGSTDVEFLPQPGPYTDMGWNIAPDGFEELLVRLATEFPGQPLMITENGAAFRDQVEQAPSGPRVHDAERVDYLNRHFTAAHRAMHRGVDLRGFLVWSLFDNFEWAYGYAKRFGIVHVDYATQQRTVKDSGRWLQRLIQMRRTPDSAVPDWVS